MMHMTKQRKILLVVLGIGATALLCDRLVLGSGSVGPDAAVADLAWVVVEPDPTQISKLPTMNPESATEIEQITVADRLAAIAVDRPPDTMARDAFMTVGKWALPKSQSHIEVSTQDPVGRFLRRHTLSAVMGSGAQGVAIVNELPLSVGQGIGGFILVDVGERSARFMCDQGQVLLRLRSSQ